MAATIVESNRGVFISLAKNSDVVLGLLVLGIVAVMIIPVPSIIMDVLLTFSLTLSIVIILISMYILKPLEFSVFPSVLLIATLARLAINVARSIRTFMPFYQDQPC